MIPLTTQKNIADLKSIQVFSISRVKGPDKASFPILPNIPEVIT